MKTYKILVLVSILLIFSFNTNAQDTTTVNKNHDQGLELYASFSGGFAVNDINDYEYSFGAYTHLDFNINKHLAYRLDIGWNDFSGPEVEYLDTDGKYHKSTPSMSVWEFTTGFRYKVSLFYVEGRAGYFTGIHSWGIVPAVGIKYRDFDLQANIILTSDVQWGGLRIGYFF